MSIVYIGIGSNLGDRKVLLDKAVLCLREKLDPKLKVSHYYETDPIGYLEQGAFINAVIKAETNLKPHAVLGICQEIEALLKRERLIRWGPRTIDLDVILFDEIVMETETLTLPHPRFHERAFVLIPMLELMDAEEAAPYTQYLQQIQNQTIRKLNHD